MALLLASKLGWPATDTAGPPAEERSALAHHEKQKEWVGRIRWAGRVRRRTTRPFRSKRAILGELERGCALEMFNGHELPEENLDDR